MSEHDLLAPTWSRRRFIGNSLALMLAGASAPALAALAGSNDLSKVVLRIADSKGGDDTFFKQAGTANTSYQIKPVRLGQASLASEALNGGAYDIGLQSNISSVFLPGTSPVRLAGFIGFRAEAFKLYVSAKSGISAPHQIKGKKVAYMRGGPLHLFLLEILKQEKLSLKDIKPIALSAQDSAAAFLSGDVDVVLAGMFGPSYQIEQGGGRLLVGGDHYRGFAENNGFSIAVHQAALADPLKRQAISDYLQRLQRTWAWLDQHEDIWATEMSRIFGVPTAFILKHRPRPYQTRILPGTEGKQHLQYVAQAFWDGGAIPLIPNTNRLWDPQLEALIPSS